MISVSAHLDHLRSLLPRGKAWAFGPDSMMRRFLHGLAEEFARADNRIDLLIEEADPRTTLELLTDWERVAALPDSCTGITGTTVERQAALRQKLIGLGGQSIAYFTELGAALGYKITIIEHRVARAGMMRAGGRVNGEAWAFAWTVQIEPFDGDLPTEQDFIAIFRAGSRAGTRLRGVGSTDIECVIRRAAPAHTTVIFQYAIEPTAALWFDFTEEA